MAFLISCRICRLLVMLSFVGLGISGLLSYSAYNLLPARPILEIVLAFISILYVYEIDKKAAFYGVCSFLYLICGYYVARSGSGALDFLLIYKAYVYFVFLSFLVGKRSIDKRYVRMLYRVLCLLYLSKYVVWLLIGVSDRPGLYGENNFELVFILLLFIGLWSFASRAELIDWFVLFVIFLLSGSRSGMVALFVAIFVLNLRPIDGRFLAGLLFLAVVFVGVIYSFLSRVPDGGFERIDRFVFLLVFISEIQYWGVWEFLTGSPPITALSDFSCSRLSFYQNLFSYSDPSVCYSVILHSFVLRTIFDHGILGLIFMFCFVNYGLLRAGMTLKVRLAVLGVIFMSGLSVSSLNSIFVAFGLAILFSLNIKSVSGIKDGLNRAT
ncbi:hypothetical protein [Saccharophagus degradans]|uniref:O-antigen polymerase n=2 Tax=Saccharophagus degradans TaxID=86304 RepID=A0AAW7X3A6_9GAMM|nr:hypothetical protein [Saccharophagus degradans]MDO6421063.1 hypothetical protein [Saccharophagus degradans]MDO6606026.1 hypothetical protein [Saccharophagus degradans]